MQYILPLKLYSAEENGIKGPRNRFYVGAEFNFCTSCMDSNYLDLAGENEAEELFYAVTR
jgi:hypothetical protein